MYDRGVSESPKPRVLIAQFGDGYEMRAADGINNTPRSWSLQFNNRTKSDIDKLYKFFTTLASVSTCKLTVPHAVDGEETVTVVIEDFKRQLQYDDYYNLDAKAREVFPGGDTRASAHYSPYPLSISKASLRDLARALKQDSIL